MIALSTIVMKEKQKFKRILNCLPSKEVERDWQFENFAEAGLIDTTREPPASKDLREAWWTIGDQEDTGSCVGWAAADGILRWHFVKAKRLSKNELISPRFIWMASKETDEFITTPTTFIEEAGTSIKQALEIGKKYGCVLNSLLPFNSGKLFSGKQGEFFAIANTRRIDSYIPLRNLSEWKSWLAFEGPILTRLDVDSNWSKLSNDRTGNLDNYQQPPRPAGHAATIVGYTPERFIVRNSWGTDWGDQGFAYASLGYAQEAFRERWRGTTDLEAYGIKVY
jgi:hypothetical protein